MCIHTDVVVANDELDSFVLLNYCNGKRASTGLLLLVPAGRKGGARLLSERRKLLKPTTN